MKKILIVLLALSILAFAGVAIAAVDNTPGIEGTPHDIPTFLTASKSGTEPCAFCHTPHVAVGALVYPLWNRSQTSQTYTMYTSPTMNMTFTATGSASLDMSTRACMQCHNGQSSTLLNYPGRGNNVEAKYDFTGTNLGNFGNLGTDLKQEHPVSFTYVSGNDADGANNFPTVTDGKVATYYPLYGVSATDTPTLMGCGTCHEPHDRFAYGGKSTGSTGTQVFFLRNGLNPVGNAGSAMCTTCHQAKY